MSKNTLTLILSRQGTGKAAAAAYMLLCLLACVLFAPIRALNAASAPTKVTIHVPSKSLSVMPYYFGKDKGFFAAEQIEPQLVMMSPPTAIAALVGGELDFSSTTGAATSAIMRGLPVRDSFTFSKIRHTCFSPSPRSNRSKA